MNFSEFSFEYPNISNSLGIIPSLYFKDSFITTFNKSGELYYNFLDKNIYMK